MTGERDNPAGEPSENSRSARGTQRRGVYGRGGRGGRGGSVRLGDRFGIRRFGAGAHGFSLLSSTTTRGGRQRGSSTMGRRAPGWRPAATDYNDTTLPGLTGNNIPTPRAEGAESFEMSDLWSTLPRNSQPQHSGPTPSHSSHENENDRLLTGQRDGSGLPIASETHLLSRIETALYTTDNATCLRLLEDAARIDHRLGALLLQSSSYYNLLSRQFEASQPTGRQAMDDVKKKGKIFFLLRKGLQDGYIGTEDERELFGLLAELHISSAQTISSLTDSERMQE
jgi:hypothetical protein